MMQARIKEFLHLLESERFYDAHEVLEEIWFPRRFEDDDEIRLLKGFINAAVSFELLKKGRKPQAKKVWLNYLKYRQLLYKVHSPYYNLYHKLSREIEKYQKKLYTRKNIL